jgi:hypothetical protein
MAASDDARNHCEPRARRILAGDSTLLRLQDRAQRSRIGIALTLAWQVHRPDGLDPGWRRLREALAKSIDVLAGILVGTPDGPVGGRTRD